MRPVVKSCLVVLALSVGLSVSASTARAGELDLTGSGACTGTSCGALTGLQSPFTIDGTTFWDFAGLLWSVTETQTTGTGVIESFVRIQGSADVVDGHNTSGSLLNDEVAGTHTHDVQLGDLTAVDLFGDGVTYYQFLLDINQTSSDPLLSLSGLQFCTSDLGGLSLTGTCYGEDNNDPGKNKGATGSTALNYDMDGLNSLDPADTSKSVRLDYNLNSGSGSGDLFVYVPTTLFSGSTDDTYLYLWSQFGIPHVNNDGFEEWAYQDFNGGGGGTDPLPLVATPEPATLIMLGTGLLIGGGAIRRRSRRLASQR